MIAIDNKYRLMSQMSHNEKYDIWEALDLQLEKKIVVEIFNDSKLENKVKEKVQQYAQINHPSLISVHTAGMFQNQPYIVLDYAEGKSLNAYMKDTFNNWKILALFFKQITEGIHVLHEHKMGHHNLTANQIYIRPNNEVIILMDFPKLILEEQQLFLFDDVMALGEMLQTFLTEARVPAKLLEIVQKTKQCRLIEYTTEHILQDIEEFLQSNQPKFVDIHSTSLFFNKWGLLSILLIIVSCVIFKYAYDHGAFKKRVIQFIPKELKEEDILKLFDNNFDTQKQPKVDNEANKIEKPSSSKNNRKVFPIQQESMQEELESNENNFQVQPKPMTKEELERREKLSKIQKQYDELMQVIKEKKNKLRKYNQNYEELEKQKLVLTREIEKSQSKLERLSKQKDGAQRQYKTLEEQINLRKKEYQKSTNLWNKYQVSFQKTEKDIQNLQDNIEKAKQDKFELEKKLSNLQAKHRELEISMQSKKSRCR